MRTIGTITFHSSINYGAVLQTYALQRVLTDWGYASEVIDYRNSKRGLVHLSPLLKLRHFLWANVRKLLFGDLREKRTNEFRERHLTMSPETYTLAQQLHSQPPLYDAYITGSDQVWNPRNNGCDSSYFLSFAPEGRRRIAYAASFGLSKIPTQFASDYREWLTGIHYLSTREIEGQRIIWQLIGSDAAVVLDPTLLISGERWIEVMAEEVGRKPYILCYYMPGDPIVNNAITAISREIELMTGWDVVKIGEKEYKLGSNSVFDAGPAEFLRLLYSASFVITNSFHGVAFSTNFEKPFLVPINTELPPDKALSSRITSLLQMLDLNSRVLPALNYHVSRDMLTLDYQGISSKLEQQRRRSLSFLKRALEEV